MTVKKLNHEDITAWTTMYHTAFETLRAHVTTGEGLLAAVKQAALAADQSVSEIHARFDEED